MSQAHHEAVRLSVERPFTMGSSRKSLLPSRMRRPQTTPNVRISHRFSHPDQELLRQVTHEHILSKYPIKLYCSLLNRANQIQ